MSNIEHPKHYNTGNIEVIDAIQDWKLNFNLGSAVKYIARAEYKENKIEDLKKAIYFIEYEIKQMEAKDE